MLTQRQIDQYQKFGFLILRNVLSEDEIQRINTEFNAKLASTSGGKSDGEKLERMSWSSLGPETPFTSTLLEESRIGSIVDSLYDED